MSKFIPRALAYDLLFGHNKVDAFKAIDMIYEGFDSMVCENCKHCKHTKDYKFQICKSDNGKSVCTDFEERI